MEPELAVEVGIDVARDASGRWRHPHACTAPAPTSPPPTSPHDVAAALTAARARRPRRRATS
ncbi:hypothetical protein ACFYWX_31950 [Streptomyces sp. NPDC002888]|uniref:hypothetical protein n=1 Tax=Streptomyces sp. NPDC002888 TaxID=3364668 RepID=UPI0036B16E1D